MSSIVQNLSKDTVGVLNGLTSKHTVEDVKKEIAELLDASWTTLIISINGKWTTNAMPIFAYGWKPGDVVTLVRHNLTPKVLSTELGKPEIGLFSDEAGCGHPKEVNGKPEYGYLQIHGYAKKKYLEKTTGEKPGAKLWVALPDVHEVEVLTRPRGSSSERVDTSLQKGCHIAQSCISPRSESTIASISEQLRCVRFRDGLRPGSEEATDVSQLALADWSYVDRDACGFSLHEYAPNDPVFWEFASSNYGRLFLEELSQLHASNAMDKKNAMSCKLYKDLYDEEMRELDERLTDAVNIASSNASCLKSASAE